MTIFGDTNAYSDWNEGVGNTIRGILATCPSVCTANSITAYITTFATNIKFKCALFVGSTKAYVAVTEEITVAANLGGVYQWQTFNFSSPPSLINQTYYIVIWGDSANGSIGGTYGGSSSYNQAIAYGIWPDPFVPSTDSNTVESIYVTVTEAVADPQLVTFLKRQNRGLGVLI